MIEKKIWTTQSELEMADNEINILRECNEARVCNIIELIESFETRQHHFIVTKFMPSGSLLNYLKINKN